MDQETAIQRLTEDFAFLYYFVRLERMEEDAVIRFPVSDTHGCPIHVKDEKVRVKGLHYSTLWLISVLLARGKTTHIEIGDDVSPYVPHRNSLGKKLVSVCLLEDLEAILFWKHEVGKNRPKQLLDLLIGVGYIRRFDSVDDEREKLLALTHTGIRKLAGLTAERHENMRELFKLLRIPRSEYDLFVKKFGKVADRAWDAMRREYLDRD